MTLPRLRGGRYVDAGPARLVDIVRMRLLAAADGRLIYCVRSGVLMSWSHSAAYPLRLHVRDHLADRHRLLPARATGIVTVVLVGELDLTVTSSLAEELAQVLGRKPRQLVFDMAGVGFIDCAAARVIAAAGGFLPGGRAPVIRNPSPAVRRVLELTGLDACCQVELGRSAADGQPTFFHR